MLLLNVACGDNRIRTSDWVNVDFLYEHFPEGNPLREILRYELDNDPTYVNMDISIPWWPGRHPDENANRFGGAYCGHVLEHWDVPGALHILRETYKCLKPGGVLRVTVPDASYFREVYPEDRRENWTRLFEPCTDASGKTTFLAIGLFFEQHKQCYTEDALWCQLVMAGFPADKIRKVNAGQSRSENPAGQVLTILDTRPKFSLHMECEKG